MAYWSDVYESAVHKTHFSGSSHSIFMSSVTHSIGTVDGGCIYDRCLCSVWTGQYEMSISCLY